MPVFVDTIKVSLNATSKVFICELCCQLETGYLKHVSRVFERIGFSRATSRSDWDVLWSYHYPFGDKKLQLHSLKPSQRVSTKSSCVMNDFNIPYGTRVNWILYQYH